MAAPHHLGRLRLGRAASAILAASGVRVLPRGRGTFVLPLRRDWCSCLVDAASAHLDLQALARPDDLVRAITRAVRPANHAARSVARASGWVVAGGGVHP